MAQQADINEFEAGLKKYLAAAQNGEQVFISNGKELIAVLGPAPKTPHSLIGSISEDELRGIDLSNVKIHGNLDDACIMSEDSSSKATKASPEKISKRTPGREKGKFKFSMIWMVPVFRWKTGTC